MKDELYRTFHQVGAAAVIGPIHNSFEALVHTTTASNSLEKLNKTLESFLFSEWQLEWPDGEVHSILSSRKFSPKFVSLCVTNKQIQILGDGRCLVTYFISQYIPSGTQTNNTINQAPSRANNKV
jgi:hypothetical protein